MRLGKYETLSEIGQGGMSVVYRAKDCQLEREVALKVMHAFLAEQAEARARFRREAVAVARLRHPHIIEIYDYAGENATQSYIVTELVDGTSLATRLAGAPIAPPEAALIIGRAVADALAHAHEHGVIHRDLKPENILIGRDGSLKLTDFGIAHMLDSQTLTLTGTLLGSPAYMAPEYIDGADTDERTDIFSFGAMLYQLVTGRLPFEAQSPHALLKRIVAGEYTLAEQRNPKVHAQVARIIRRALSREPAARFQSARDVLQAIDQVLARLELDPEVERPKLLTDPEYGAALEAALLMRYVNLGKAEIAKRQVGVALEDFDRVLSIDPKHAEVRHIVNRLTRRAWRGRILRDGAVVLLGAALLTAGGVRALEWRAERARLARAQSESAAVTPDAKKNVTFIIRGSGDLYIDGSLAQREVKDALAVELPPGPHVARIEGVQRDSKSFEVPAEGSVPPVKLDAGQSPQAAPQPPTPYPREPASTTAQSPAAPHGEKQLKIRIAGGLWVNVYLDDVEIAREQTSPVQLTLTYGKHRLRFSNPCCEPAEIPVTVSATEPPEIEPIDLRPSPARLFIEGAPPGARVEVAGKREGLRPGEPVFVPMTVRGPAEYVVQVIAGNHVLLRELARFEPGQELRLAVHPN